MCVQLIQGPCRRQDEAHALLDERARRLDALMDGPLESHDLHHPRFESA
ncbi:hypothetical protein [Nocardioides rubriscoriae]|nr:hypothetical protein [Nocardioides rubriscoriae]